MAQRIEGTRQARNELYEVMRGDASFENKARRALELGREYLGADNGHLTRIDTDAGHWEALVSTDSPDGRIPPGLELNLDTTYCRRTIASEDPIALTDAPSEGWEEDPAFQTHGYHCYHGSTLYVDDGGRETVESNSRVSVWLLGDGSMRTPDQRA